VIFQGNPTAIDHGPAAQMELQHAVHAHVVSNGLRPISPAPQDRQFDVAWVAGRRLPICEVKSLTDDNEETQLRLGLGQSLNHLHRSKVEYFAGVDEITGVLAVEHQPSPTD